MKLKNTNAKNGMFLKKEDKEYLLIKSNKNFFYCVELLKDSSPIVLMEKFYSKPKSVKVEEICKQLDIFKSKYSNDYDILDKPFLIYKKANNNKTKVKDCCANSARNVYLKKLNKFGKFFCKRCGSSFNNIKLENDGWLSFSQNLVVYQVQIKSGEIRKYNKEKLI